MSEGEEILAALAAYRTNPPKLAAVVHRLEEVIINQYDGTPFEKYKSNWIARILNEAKKQSIECTNSKPNWAPIASRIIDHLVANRVPPKNPGEGFAASSALTIDTSTTANVNDSFVSPAAAAAETGSSSSSSAVAAANVVSPVFFAPASPSTMSSVSTAVSPSTEDSDSISMKLVTLSDDDKKRVSAMYDSLDQSKMWKLKTGTIVQDVMKRVATSIKHEYPSQSMILDLTDKCWEKAFLPNELQEIREFQAINMPPMPSDVTSYLNQLQDLTSDLLFKKLQEDKFPMESDLEWIRLSYLSAFRLVRSDFFPITKRTEGDLLKRVWLIIDSCFDFGNINCTGGEKSSQASADTCNANRSISNPTRQSSGRKMDYIFSAKRNDYELGCGECGLVVGTNTTKELYDASFKLPLVMKDMAFSLVSSRPSLLHDTVIAAFFIGVIETRVQLKTMDFPCGSVARVDAFEPLSFPKTEVEIARLLPAVVTLILGSKLLMETTRVAVENYQQPIVIRKKDAVSPPILPNFVPLPPPKNKKRRRSCACGASSQSTA